MPYSVFVSHGWHDRWVARQITENTQRRSGAETFIDIFDIRSGDRIEEKVHDGLSNCNELVSLLTPWSNSKRVFLSASTGDRAFSSALAELISARGADVFVDSNVAQGDAWADTLRREIEKATALVLVVPSPTVPNRNSLWFEAGAARALGKRVLAVLPPRGRSSDLPADVADLAILDADRRPLAEIADTVVQAIPEVETEAVAAS